MRIGVCRRSLSADLRPEFPEPRRHPEAARLACFAPGPSILSHPHWPGPGAAVGTPPHLYAFGVIPLSLWAILGPPWVGRAGRRASCGILHLWPHGRDTDQTRGGAWILSVSGASGV